MTTTLAEQLQRLAVPQTAIYRDDRKRASLLFDPKEAATISRETVYQIGLEGLEELIQRNPAFSQFTSNLYNLTSKEFERSMHNAAANQKLDKTVRQFLLLLSPYFLLSPAHKALEWLIQRFRIHQYNKLDFIMFMLPYHESNIFVKALQLVPIDDRNNVWLWLKPLQKKGIHLPKQTLYVHAGSNPNFLYNLSNFVLSAIRENKNPSVLTTLFNFYSTTITGALQHSEVVRESQITQILKILLKGTKSSVPDFCAGTYIIIAKLVSKCVISNDLLSRFITNVSLVPVTRLRTEATLLTIIVYQTQRQFTFMPDEAITNFLKHKWISKLLKELNVTNNYISPFLEAFFKGLIAAALTKDDFEDGRVLLDELLGELKLDDGFVVKIIK